MLTLEFSGPAQSKSCSECEETALGSVPALLRCGVPFIRSIGRWTMTALVINGIIGSGIFGVPSELIRLLGRASMIAMIIAALGMAIIMVCVAEVASQFSEP